MFPDIGGDPLRLPCGTVPDFSLGKPSGLAEGKGGQFFHFGERRALPLAEVEDPGVIQVKTRCFFRDLRDADPREGRPVDEACGPVSLGGKMMDFPMGKLGRVQSVGNHLDDEDGSSRSHHADHFPKYGFGVFQMMEGIDEAGDVESPVGIGKAAPVHHFEPDSRSPFEPFPGRGDRFFRSVDSDDLPVGDFPFEKKGDELARSRAHIEDPGRGEGGEESFQSFHARPSFPAGNRDSGQNQTGFSPFLGPTLAKCS